MQYQSCARMAQPQDRQCATRVSPDLLAAANINPATGLAADYLNHFNEAIMLLDMVSSFPDCRDDLLAWRPLGYCEHFAASRFRGRDLAIAAYQSVDPAVRARLEAVSAIMHHVLEETIAFLMTHDVPSTVEERARQAAAQLRRLVMSASAVINGSGGEGEADFTQAAIDELMNS